MSTAFDEKTRQEETHIAAQVSVMRARGEVFPDPELIRLYKASPFTAELQLRTLKLIAGVTITADQARELAIALMAVADRLAEEANPGPPTIERKGVTLYRARGGRYVSIPED